MSWIHIDDLVNLYIRAIEDETYKGVYTQVSPLAVSNQRPTILLAKSVRGRFYVSLHVPSFLLKWYW